MQPQIRKFVPLALSAVCGVLVACGAEDMEDGSDESPTSELESLDDPKPESMPPEGEVSEANQEVRFGTIVPVANRGVTESAVVQLRTVNGTGPICTATLLRPTWVITAKHCVGDELGNIVARDVMHDAVAGSQQTVPAASIFWHPDPAVDAALLRLNTPINAGQMDINLYSGNDANVVGRTVTTYGYGVKDVMWNACSATVACPAGWNACSLPVGKTVGHCFLPSAELRRADLKVAGVRETSGPHNRKYLSLPANASLQQILPGDSGGPVFQFGAIVGVNGGVDVVAYAKSFRQWVNSMVSPPNNHLLLPPSSSRGAFSPGAQVPLTGDFNNDGFADLVTFTRSSTLGTAEGDVHVSLGSASGYGAKTKWSDWFVVGTERPGVGDFNGDGRDDLVAFDQGSGRVWVTLSNGVNGFGAAQLWHTGFSYTGETPRVGDLNGDGRDDIVTFVHHNNWGAVWVSLSCGVPSIVPWPTGCVIGSTFGTRINWTNGFSLLGETPQVGDVNGDGLADLATFASGGVGSVSLTARQSCTSNAQCSDNVCWSSISRRICPGTLGQTAGPKTHWTALFTPSFTWPTLLDMNGDGRDDLVSFEGGSSGRLGVMLSSGLSFGTFSNWGLGVCNAGKACMGGDRNADGRMDLFRFETNGDVKTVLSLP